MAVFGSKVTVIARSACIMVRPASLPQGVAARSLQTASLDSLQQAPAERGVVETRTALLQEGSCL